MPIIDMHAHIYPDAIARKASDATGKFYGLAMAHDGTLGQLLEVGRRCGISRFLVHSVATTPTQVTSINRFLKQIVDAYPNLLIPFGAMHPDFADIPVEVGRMIESGFRGIKLHPDIQRFAVDDPRAFPIYEASEGKLPILCHVGDNRYRLSDPERVASVLKRFPNLTMICAHLGGYSQWEKAGLLMEYPNVYIDTSSSTFALDPAEAARIIRAFGVERCFFGSDYPMWDTETELERFYKLPLTEKEREAILWKNAARFLNLDIESAQ